MRQGDLKKIVLARPMRASRKAAATKTGANASGAATKTGANASGKTKTTGANASGKTEETEQEVHQEISTETFIIMQISNSNFFFPQAGGQGGSLAIPRRATEERDGCQEASYEEQSYKERCEERFRQRLWA